MSGEVLPPTKIKNIKLYFLREVDLDVAHYEQGVLQLDVDPPVRPLHEVHVRDKRPH